MHVFHGILLKLTALIEYLRTLLETNSFTLFPVLVASLVYYCIGQKFGERKFGEFYQIAKLYFCISTSIISIIKYGST